MDGYGAPPKQPTNDIKKLKCLFYVFVIFEFFDERKPQKTKSQYPFVHYCSFGYCGLVICVSLEIIKKLNHSIQMCTTAQMDTVV